jgi:hypothetical protein
VELDLPTSAAWNRLHAPGMPGEGLPVWICRGLAVQITPKNSHVHSVSSKPRGHRFWFFAWCFWFHNQLTEGVQIPLVTIG